MRKILLPELSRGRIRSGYFGSDDDFGTHGAFILQGPCGMELKIIASDGTDEVCQGWEHVSVSLKNRTPNWTEMSYVKNLFWDESETVLQFHPRQSEYINQHPYCLHLWRQIGKDVELPPALLIGVVSKGV